MTAARVGLLEARLSAELAEMVRRQGGEPVCGPAVEEAPLACRDEVQRFVTALERREVPIVVFLTGVGAAALLGEASALGLRDALVAGLARSATVCRGPKPAGVLSRAGVTVDVRVPEPHTTVEVLRALDAFDLDETGIGILHYGERNDALADALRGRGAWLHELSLYEWRLPRDVEPLRRVVRAIVGGGMDAVAFTSQIQVRHLMLMAGEMDLLPELLRALNTHTVTAAVGPTCAAALRVHGITPHVVPAVPKLGPMVAALFAYLGQGRVAPPGGGVP
jgi:uroporphyrinogen-III synthase